MEDQGGASLRIEKLTDSNFYIWKQKIQLLLALKDVDHNVIESEVPGLPESDDRRTWLRGDIKAKAIIGLSLSDEHLEHVRDCETAKQMWEAIINVFERHTLLNKLAAWRRFYTVTMQNDEKVLAYINRVKQLAARLKSMNVDIDDKEMAMAVLNGLPARFESLIVALDALGSEDKMFSLDFVKSRLLQEEQRAEMKDKPSSSPKDLALMNRVPGTGRPSRDMHCTNCGRSGHTASHCWEKDINGRRPPPPSSYKSRKNQDRKPAAFVSNDGEEKPRFTFESDEAYTFLMAKIEQSAVQSQSTSWLVDSACTTHMTFVLELYNVQHGTCTVRSYSIEVAVGMHCWNVGG